MFHFISFVYAKTSENSLNGNLEMTLLWENPNPSSEMSNQTITLLENLTNYKFYIVMFEIELNKKGMSSTGWLSTQHSALLQGFTASLNGTEESGLLMYRYVSPVSEKSNQVVISNGYYVGEYNKLPTVYTGACIPKRIYGIGA